MLYAEYYDTRSKKKHEIWFRAPGVPRPAGDSHQCPACGNPLEKKGPTSSWLLAFMTHTDQDGRVHSHDPNRHRDVWLCTSCGAIWNHCFWTPCPVPGCTFMGDREFWERITMSEVGVFKIQGKEVWG